ncbi:dynactin subunit 1 isoform X2 [Nematostella vectensis]|uniref:dynactin subunit 1 isoform X2 n=1 Tax=Nematostella vectensis TaxID=45351 RepID=UPI0020779BDC|nr:dynactin subunit 1 isoform X2 [Nematostella vectensis]
MATVKVGMKVEVTGKGLIGTVAYVGATQFATGKWIGVVLDEKKGKNDGTVQGKAYFSCEDGYGIFVRQSQIIVLDSNTSTPQQPGNTGIPKPGIPTLRKEKFGSRGSLENVAAESKSSPPTSKIQSPKTSTVSQPTPRGTSLPEPKVTGRTSLPTASTPPIETKPAVHAERKPSGPSVSADEFLELQKKVLDKDKVIVDLEGKLETLKAKRLEDKHKMKDLEKARMQLQQMIEYKSKWQEAQRDLQNQLTAAKKELKEVLQSKDSEDLTELQEAVEMATLDKEMAEERLEGMMQENEQLKERVEELTLDLEILRSEISEGGVEGAAANAQVKQLEQQNTRLKEAIVRFKEIQMSDKQQLQSLQKQVKDLHSANTSLQADKDKLMEEAEQLESTLAELKEQVDTALGAEEMVETLTDKNLELEEELKTLRDTVSDLEALRDLNEELEETHLQTEQDLREELDMTSNKVREAERKYEQAQDSIGDLQQTIEKFRDLVAKLQESNREIQEKQEDSEKRLIDLPPTPDIMDFKVKSAEIKSLAKSVDNEMRKFQVQQANEHIKMLNSFLPDAFLRRGGDNDSILLLLLIPRLDFKTELLIDQLRQKYELADCLDDVRLITGHKAEGLSFSSMVMYNLATLQAVVRHFRRAVSKCDPALFNKLVGIYPELAAHEKAVDKLIDLLKADQLDDTVGMEPLEKAIHYYSTMARFHLGNDPISCTEFLNDQLNVLNVAADGMTVEVERLKGYASGNCDNGSTFMQLVSDMELRNVEVRQLCKKIKRRMPQDDKSILSFAEKVQVSLVECVQQQGLLLKFCQDLVSVAAQKAATLPDNEHLLSGQLEEMAMDVAVLVYEKEDVSAYKACSETFHEVMSFLAGFAIKMQEGEYDAQPPEQDTKVQPPYLERSKAFKSELFDTAGVEEKLLQKESNVREIKKTLKLKSEEVSQANIRIGLLEKRLENASKEADARVEAANKKMEQAMEELQKKKKEYEDTMDELQADIDTLEKEKEDMKKRLDAYSKRTLLADLARHTSASSGIAAVVAGGGNPLKGGSPLRAAGAGQQPVQVVIKDSPIILAQVESLKIALRHLKNENIRLKSHRLKSKLSELPEIFVPPTIGPRHEALEQQNDSPDTKETLTLATVTKETNSLLEKLQRMSVTQKVVDISGRKPGTIPVLHPPPPHLCFFPVAVYHIQ